MSGFAIFFSRRGAPDRAVIAAAAGAFSPWPEPNPRRWRQGPDGDRREASGGGEAVVLAAEDLTADLPGGGLLVADARLDGVASGKGATRRLAALWRPEGGRSEGALPALGGEFAVAVLDRRRLLIQRDLFGVRPLYFMEKGDEVWVSTLPAVLLAAARAIGERRLCETTVLDHLLFSRSLEPESTVWQGLKRLPPASRRWWSPGGSAQEIYDRLEAPAPLQLGTEELVQSIRSALDTAVLDRLDDDGRANLWMSGGLDSTSVAASCAAVGAQVVAHTVSYERLIDDREGEMAALAARHLALEHHRHAVDDFRLFERWRDLPPSPLPSEPELDAMYLKIDRLALDHAGVALTGLGADPLLLPERRWPNSVGAWLAWWRAYLLVGQRPPLGVASRWARWRQSRAELPPLPAWLNQDFAARTAARQRQDELPRVVPPRAGHRAEALAHTLDASWADLFEKLDAGVRGVAIVRRHPFFDRRLVELLLALPSLPWSLDKWALRQSQRGRLPEVVRRRAKTPLAGDPWPGVAEPLDLLWREFRATAPVIESILQVDWIERVLREQPSDRRRWALCGRALSFACWLAIVERGR